MIKNLNYTLILKPSQQTVKQNMQIPREIFKSYDIRGFHEQITNELAEKIGYFVAKNTGDKIIVIGRDMRESSDRIADSIIKGVVNAGAKAIDIGLCTTSLFNFIVSEKYNTGLMVTASHNPSAYNGVKVMSKGMPISGHDLFEMISDNVLDLGNVGEVEKVDFLDEYLDHCIKLLGINDKIDFKIVIDYGNGMASTTVQPLLEKIGMSAIELFSEPNSQFPNHEANPAKVETMKVLQERVLLESADFGIAFDGDADRIAFVDEKGGLIPGDQMLAIYAEYLLKKEGGGKVIGAPNQGKAIRDLVSQNDGEYIDVPIGRTNTIKAVKEHNAVIGGELAFHVMFKQMNGLESIDYALLLMMKILNESGKSLSQLVNPLRIYSNSGEINIEVDDKKVIMDRIEEAFARKASKVSKLDGIRCDFGEDWWFIVRASNTEPVLRLTVEGKDKKNVKQKTQEILELMA